MANDRRAYSQAEELALTTQVSGRCPLCGAPLFYVKKSRSYKAYELAHIYPLNPTAEEVEELEGVRRLHADVNHPDNQIPLCRPCHGRFDKPRTVEEYQQLAAVKQQLIARSVQQALYTRNNGIRLTTGRLPRIVPSTVRGEYQPGPGPWALPDH